MLMFNSLDHMIDWYLRHAGHIYEAPTHFQNMMIQARNARNSIDKQTKKELREHKNTQIVQPSHKRYANITYCFEDEIIAKVDFENSFRKLSKREQEVMKRLINQDTKAPNGKTVYGGMKGAHTAVKRYYRDRKTIKQREEVIFQIIWKWEDMLVDAEYIKPHWSEECLDEVESWAA